MADVKKKESAGVFLLSRHKYLQCEKIQKKR